MSSDRDIGILPSHFLVEAFRLSANILMPATGRIRLFSDAMSAAASKAGQHLVFRHSELSCGRRARKSGARSSKANDKRFCSSLLALTADIIAPTRLFDAVQLAARPVPLRKM